MTGVVLIGERDPVLTAGRRALVAALVGALVGLVAAGSWYLSRPLTYSSTIALELSAVAPFVDLNPVGPRVPEVTVDTDAQLVASDSVVAAVASGLGVDEADVRDRLSVRARPASRVLELTYATTDSAEVAQQGVTTAATAYLDQRERLIIEPVRTYLDAVADGTDEVQGGYEQERDDSVRDVSRGQQVLENRLERAQRYQVRLPVPGSVVAAASAPTARRGTADVVLVSGAGLGALLGFGVGLAWERRARR